jgi:hypothetical protein
MTLKPPYELVNGSYFFYDLDLPGLPAKAVLGGREFELNSLLHVSLITNLRRFVPQLVAKLDAEEDEALLLLVDSATALIAEIQPKLIGYRSDLRVAKRGDDETIVIMVDVSGLDELQHRLGDKFGLDIPSRPAHVTLYLLPGSQPVPIRDQQQLQEYTRPLTEAELAELKKQIDFEKIFGVNV